MMKIYHREMECPMCGKSHILTLYEHDSFYLDGTPAITVEQFLASQALCTKCGFMYTHIPPENVCVWDVWHSEEYQRIMKEEYHDETERKLKLYTLFHDYEYIPLYFSHYYAEIGDREKECEWLKKAIQLIKSGEDDIPYFLDRMPFKHFHMQYEFSVLPEYRLVDMYRRLGDFEGALAYIERLRATPDVDAYGLDTYLDAEKQLILAGNTNLV